MKKLGFMVAILISLLVSGGFVNANLSFDYFVQKVEVDGTEVSPSSIFYRPTEVNVQRGEALPVDVWVQGFNNVDNVRVEVSLKGYERGTIRATSEIFELDSNTVKKIPLVLNIPSDLDASETYTLVVEVSDKQNGVVQEYLLRVKEKRHSLNILDVIFRPSSTVESGRFLRTVVRVENLGAKDEKDIRVTVSIPNLGVSTRDFVDKLVTLDNKNDDSSLSTNELILQIPRDAKEGDYDVRIDVEYNRGTDIVSLTKSIHVLGEKEGTQTTESIISIDSTSKTIELDEEGTFRLTIANLNDQRHLYNIQAIGADTWADVIVEPSFISVGASELGNLNIVIKPKENAALGSKVFTLKVSEDNKQVKEINLNAEITSGEKGISFNLRSILEVLFAILIVVLIVLALIIAFKRIKGREQGPGVETNSEQTYY